MKNLCEYIHNFLYTNYIKYINIDIWKLIIYLTKFEENFCKNLFYIEVIIYQHILFLFLQKNIKINT